MNVLRTPDDAFAAVPDFPWEPKHAETSDGLRMAYVDEGSGPVVLLLHGEPSWSFLWRKLIPVFLDAGCRVVAPDLIGFGRSDKPSAVEDYSYAGHVEWLRSVLFDSLALQDVTLVAQDWGGLLGLRLVAENPGRFARVVAANTGLPDGLHRLPEEWWRFRDFVARTPDLPIGFLVSAACLEPMPPEVVAAYDAPFPTAAHKAGALAFPDLIPQTADNPATPANQQAWEVLSTLWAKPFLCAYSDGDPITRGGDKPFRERVPGCQGQPHTTIAGGGHFLQEDRGPELAQVVVDWLRHLGAL
ncbi:MAG TPA: haloalkane dehalogenase [Mycobacteriales bacterium]|nr:haloalkane dehalogenase [Mycobacteriales bacterium]